MPSMIFVLAGWRAWQILIIWWCDLIIYDCSAMPPHFCTTHFPFPNFFDIFVHMIDIRQGAIFFINYDWNSSFLIKLTYERRGWRLHVTWHIMVSWCLYWRSCEQSSTALLSNNASSNNSMRILSRKLKIFHRKELCFKFSCIHRYKAKWGLN